MPVPEGRPDAKMWWRTRPSQSARLPAVSSSDETAPRLRQRHGLMEIGVGPTGRGGFLQIPSWRCAFSAFRCQSALKGGSGAKLVQLVMNPE